MCNCIETINTQLAPKHILNTTMGFHGEVSRPLVPLIRRDKWEVEKRRGEPRDMVASFCPWCGEKYPEPKKAEAD